MMSSQSPSSYADEKTPTRFQEQNAALNWRSRPSFRNRLFRHFVPAFLLISATLFLFRSTFVANGHYDASKDLDDIGLSRIHQGATEGRKVDLEAHIMSKCPDARDCLQQLVVPAMAQISDKVNFKLSYIGKVDDKSDEVSCMHGPPECLGNMIELCAARVYHDVKIYLGFANCMTLNYSQVPDRDLVQACALEHGVDFQKINKCISEEGHGSELLRNSVLRSQENNVTKSCTVRLDGKIRCIRDGGKWYDCPGGSEVSDLVRDIEHLYEKD